MLKGLLNAVVFIPVLLGIFAATRWGRKGLPLLVAGMFLFGAFYIMLAYLLYYRWVG